MGTCLSIPCEIARKASKKTPNEKSMSIIGITKINNSLDPVWSLPVSIFSCNIMVAIIAPIASPDAKRMVA